MAEPATSRKSRDIYGNLAYAQPAPQTTPQTPPQKRPEPKVRPHINGQPETRPQIAVRTRGQVSLFAVVGFLAVGIFAVLLLLSYVQLTVTTDSVVNLNRQLNTLELEEAKLLAQYELAYDLGTIENKVVADGTMVKPLPEQIIAIDLMEGDSVVRYEMIEESSGGLKLDDALSYFK